MNGTTLKVSTPSCHGSPEVVRFEEEARSVRVEVVTTRVVDGNDASMCADVVTVELEQPLGDRQVVDITSGAVVQVLSSGPAGASPTDDGPDD